MKPLYVLKASDKIEFSKILHRIETMNQIMQLPDHDLPNNLRKERVIEFKRILIAEILEADDFQSDLNGSGLQEIQAFVDLADWLADIVVYTLSEARRWGIPIGLILSLVMDSQESKLVDGKPVPGDMPGKFGKGPNYERPEPAIKILMNQLFDTKHKLKKASDDGVNYNG